MPPVKTLVPTQRQSVDCTGRAFIVTLVNNSGLAECLSGLRPHHFTSIKT